MLFDKLFKKNTGLSVDEKGNLVVSPYEFSHFVDKNPEIVIPDGCKCIPDEVFEKADGRFFIKGIVFPEGLQKIGASAFSHSDIRSLTFPSSLKEIGDYAFSGCKLLESVVLPEGLRKIGDHAFDSCERLARIALPKSLTYLGKKAFDETLISTVAIPAGVKQCGIPCANVQIDNVAQWLDIEHEDNLDRDFHHNSDFTDMYYTGELNAYKLYVGKNVLRDVVIPEGVATIKPFTFEGSNIESIQFPSTLRVIQEHAIDCPKLERLELPDGFTRLEGHNRDNDFSSEYIVQTDYVFKRLNYVRVPDSIEFFDMKITNESELKIESGVEGFNGQMVADKHAVVYLGNENNLCVVAVKSLHPNGFDVSNITVATGCRIIGGWAFAECDSESIVLPDTVVTIHARAFIASQQLRDVFIPASVHEMGPQLFADCDNLHKIRYGGTKAQWKALTEKESNKRWMYGCAVEKVECTDGIIRIDD